MDGCYTFDQSNVQLSLCRYHTLIKTIWENLHINPYTIGRFWMIITTKTAFKTQSYHRLPPTCWQAGQGKYFKIKITTEVRKILPFKNELNIFIQQSVNQPTSTIDSGSLHCKSRIIIIIINYQLMKREFQLPVLVTVSRIIVDLYAAGAGAKRHEIFHVTYYKFVLRLSKVYFNSYLRLP